MERTADSSSACIVNAWPMGGKATQTGNAYGRAWAKGGSRQGALSAAAAAAAGVEAAAGYSGRVGDGVLSCPAPLFLCNVQPFVFPESQEATSAGAQVCAGKLISTGHWLTTEALAAVVVVDNSSTPEPPALYTVKA